MLYQVPTPPYREGDPETEVTPIAVTPIGTPTPPSGTPTPPPTPGTLAVSPEQVQLLAQRVLTWIMKIFGLPRLLLMVPIWGSFEIREVCFIGTNMFAGLFIHAADLENFV